MPKRNSALIGDRDRTTDGAARLEIGEWEVRGGSLKPPFRMGITAWCRDRLCPVCASVGRVLATVPDDAITLAIIS